MFSQVSTQEKHAFCCIVSYEQRIICFREQTGTVTDPLTYLYTTAFYRVLFQFRFHVRASEIKTTFVMAAFSGRGHNFVLEVHFFI